ncbi:TerD family protein [Nocardia sp. NPDC004722]
MSDLLLRTVDGEPFESIALGLGWDPMDGAIAMEADPLRAIADRFDANLAALLFGGENLLDVVFYDHLTSSDGSVRHTGDNLTGEGDGDNEMIIAELDRIPGPVTSLIFVVTSYTARPFTDTSNAYCHVTDPVSLQEIARFVLTGGPHTAFVVGKLTRLPLSWVFTGIGAGLAATHVAESVQYLAPYLP